MDAIGSSLVIHDAWSEQPWTIEGARVEVSLICFCAPDLKPSKFHLDGAEVTTINADLTTGVDVTQAKSLRENSDSAFIGIQTTGPLDISGEMARSWLIQPTNPNGRANREVLKPYWNGDDVTGRPRDRWLIDFPLGQSQQDASAFETPFEYLKRADYVAERGKPPVPFAHYRATTPGQNSSWWEPHRPRPAMRRLIERLHRYIVTPETAEHRLFIWLRYPILPDKNLIVIARDDDTAFGILHSRFHELWSLRLGTSLEDRPRYTLTTTFATFPFPEKMTPDLPASTYAELATAKNIAAAARQLVELRDAWLNPPELVDWQPEIAQGFPKRAIPVSPSAAKLLQSRTLTNLYNERPTWLDAAHRALDATVAQAYGIQPDMSDEGILTVLLDLNSRRLEANGKMAPNLLGELSSNNT
ncbi:MAG TPA: type IIL restriction-modification enzyme MmeI [Terriglobales bacterium]|nr:type IIL restriction-modification enzyme MmeI [Terriglobales bacterium]